MKSKFWAGLFSIFALTVALLFCVSVTVDISAEEKQGYETVRFEHRLFVAKTTSTHLFAMKYREYVCKYNIAKGTFDWKFDFSRYSL